MAASPDSFARFVDLVAANRDEHAERGKALAGRLYLSRSQFDRLVSAALGEPSGRFRRRIPARALGKPIDIPVEGTDEHPTMRSLLSRLVGQLDIWNQAVANRPYDFALEIMRASDRCEIG